MGFRGKGIGVNVLQPLVVYPFVSHGSPLFLWSDHAPLNVLLIRA